MAYNHRFEEDSLSPREGTPRAAPKLPLPVRRLALRLSPREGTPRAAPSVRTLRVKRLKSSQSPRGDAARRASPAGQIQSVRNVSVPARGRRAPRLGFTAM